MKQELAIEELKLLIIKRYEMIGNGRDLHYHDDNRVTELRKFIDSLSDGDTQQDTKLSSKEENDIQF